MDFPSCYKDVSVTTKEQEGKFVIEMSFIDADRKTKTVSLLSCPAGAKEIVEKNLEKWLKTLYEKNLKERENAVKENW